LRDASPSSGISFSSSHNGHAGLGQAADTSKLGVDASAQSTSVSSASLTLKDVVPNGVSLDETSAASGSGTAGAGLKSNGSSSGSTPLSVVNQTNGLVTHHHH
jgi:hypothetical protein